MIKQVRSWQNAVQRIKEKAYKQEVYKSKLFHVFKEKLTGMWQDILQNWRKRKQSCWIHHVNLHKKVLHKTLLKIWVVYLWNIYLRMFLTTIIGGRVFAKIMPKIKTSGVFCLFVCFVLFFPWIVISIKCRVSEINVKIIKSMLLKQPTSFLSYHTSLKK